MATRGAQKNRARSNLPGMALPLHPSIPRSELATAWMHHGIDLLNANTPASLEEAVRCFDRAIALRCALPLALDENPLYPRRLAIAWINRGIARQKEKSAITEADAIRCFREALAVLEDSPAAAISDLGLLRAGALTNLAAALLNVPGHPFAEARDLAQQAVALLRETEQNDVTAAEAGFKARYVLCRAIAAESRDGQSVPTELVAAAAGAADDGLALARHWEERGDSGFRAPTEDLFHFGCRIHQTGPPHILTGFILESLDPEKAEGVLPFNLGMHQSAVAALWIALTEIQRDGFRSISTPRFEQLLENVRELRVTEERLEQLRRTAPV